MALDSLIPSERNLRSLRRAHGLTQEKLAAEIGYSPSYYAMVEREPRLLRAPMVARLAAVLGVPESLISAIGAARPAGRKVASS